MKASTSPRVPRLGSLFAKLRAACLGAGLTAACGGGDTPGDGQGAGCTGCAQVAGVWVTTEVADSTACGGSVVTESQTYTIVQNGCELTVKPASADVTFYGSVCHDSASWSGSYPEGSGTTTITSSSYTLKGTTVSGVAQWTWTNGTKTCSGTTQVTATPEQ